VVATDGARPTVGSVLADEFDLAPEAVERYLRSGDPVDTLQDAYEVLEEHDELETGDDYGTDFLALKHNNFDTAPGPALAQSGTLVVADDGCQAEPSQPDR